MASSQSMLQETHQGQGVANILAIGTANPPICFHQSKYPDFYFQVTKSEHMTQLKHKYQRICEKSAIKKRYLYQTEDMIKKNPNLGIYRAPSFDFRQEILIREVPKLGKEAALKAIEEWGQPVSKITHLIFCTSACVNTPSADHQLAKLIGLNPSIQRFMIYGQGCFAGCSALRLSKDLAENNAGARVLIVCVEFTLASFHAPSETQLSMLVGSAIFADGAAAMIVGVDPNTNINERPLFQIMSAKQTTVPNSDTMVMTILREMGLEYFLSKDLPKCIENSIEQCFIESFTPFGIGDWNTLFYAAHPGGAAILRAIEKKLGLVKEKLKASRHVLSEYGNMRSPSVFFVLDEIRKKSIQEGKATTGEGLEWGVAVSFGPGLTVETSVLRSCALVYSAN